MTTFRERISLTYAFKQTQKIFPCFVLDIVCVDARIRGHLDFEKVTSSSEMTNERKRSSCAKTVVRWAFSPGHALNIMTQSTEVRSVHETSNSFSCTAWLFSGQTIEDECHIFSPLQSQVKPHDPFFSLRNLGLRHHGARQRQREACFQPQNT